MDKLMHEKKIIQQKVEELNYTTLRVSVFNGRNKGREDWQTRIEYDEGKKVYLVYSLGDRASIIGKIRTFGNFEEAEQCFFEILDLTVRYNRLQVMTNEEPEYPSPLWDKP